MCPAAGFCERRADVDRGNLIADFLLLCMRNSVRDDNPTEAALVDVFNGVTGKDAVHNNGVDFLGAVLHHCVRCLHEGSARIGHIVHNNGHLVLDVSYKNHPGNFVGARALLVDQGELRVQSVSKGSSSGRIEKQYVSPFPISQKKKNNAQKETYRFAPPASGLTITQFSTSKFSRIHLSILGSAYKLSTGTLKNPWIWLAWRSMVMTWLQPAV